MTELNYFFELLFNFLLIIVMLTPLVVSIFSFIFFSSIKIDNWHKNKSKIIRYFLFFTLVFLIISFLYELIFVDPESMFLYIFWPTPVGLGLIGISVITWKNGTLTEKILATVSIVITAISLVAPFIFIALRNHGIL